jgi:hypothetical protein
MEPQIRFCTSADGVSIAFWTPGEEMPFVHMPLIPYRPHPTGAASP